VVSGASGSIGRSVVARLVGRGFGVAAVARDSSRLASLAEDYGDAVVMVATDVRDPELATRLDAALGDAKVAMVVHMAAAPTAGGILDAPLAAIHTAFEVKVTGFLNLVRATRPRLADPARVVAVGGNLAYDPQPDAAVSGIGNAALANVVRQLQRAFARTAVTCHMVAPGPVATERFATLVAAKAEAEGIDEQLVWERTLAAAPVGRLTTADEVAWAIALLADPEATALAGSTLLLDGGRRTGIP
jgi:NAD(P)-dependent dehydrogenase (short-subunit alcohol dehydrogenase family)